MAPILIYVTLVSSPPGQSLSLQTLSCCCLPVSGAPRSPAGVHKGGLGDYSCQLEAAAARAQLSPRRADF